MTSPHAAALAGDLLAEPLTLPSGLTLPNRIAKASMSESLAAADGNPGPELCRLYQRWSQGGAGLLLTGNVMVDGRYRERARNVVVDGTESPIALAAWARAGKSGGNAMIAQLSHPGRQVSRYIAPEPLAPSAGPAVNVMKAFGRPRALRPDEIDDIIGRFARAAAVLERAGLDGVELHAAHGYLISQFLSPLTNQRDDGWGGDLAGRARFLLEVVRAVRAATRRGFTVAVKLNSADFQRGGFAPEESMAVVAMLETEGIDLLEISGGNYESMALFGVEEDGRPSTRAREGYFLEYARQVRRTTRLPILLTGGLRTGAGMREALASGALDVVGLARPLCVRPDLPRALLDGSAGDQRPAEAPPLQLPGRPASDPRLAALQAAAQTGWYVEQLRRMASGLDPDPSMGPLGPAVRYLGLDAVQAMMLRLRRR
jgi:2,4-dienoyl-CoA reductase-like NADH-dependent reductase (Old Yellow Enzyme family)